MDTKHWIYSKTIWFNILLTITGVFVLFDPYIPEQYTMISILVQGIGNLIIRIWFGVPSLTTTPGKVEEIQKTVDELPQQIETPAEVAEPVVDEDDDVESIDVQ